MKKSVRWLVAGAVCTALVPFVSADTVHWCGLDTSYQWLADLSWSATDNPGSDEDLVEFRNGDDAVIGSIDGVSDTVPANGAVTVGSLDFRATATVPGTGPISFAAGGGTVAVAEGATATISAPLAGTVPYVKTGKGTLVLAGDNKDLKPAAGTPITVREGLLKLTKDKPSSLGCYTSGTLPVVVEDGATLDINGAYLNLNPYPINATIAGTGHDGQGALIDTGMTAYNKYLSQITLADDALVRAASQMYVSRIESNGHVLTKIGGTQMCISSFNGNGDLVVKQGDLTAFGASSLPGGTGKTRLAGGRVAFWEGNSSFNKAVATDTGGTLHISGGSNADRCMTWTGPMDVKEGTTLSLSGAYSKHKWNIRTNPTGTGTISFTTESSTISAPTMTFPGTLYNNGEKYLYVGTRGSATGGTLGSGGWVRNNGYLCLVGEDMSFSRGVWGSGYMYVAASNKVTVAGGVFTNNVSVHCGELTLDGVKGQIPNFYVGQANTFPFATLTNVTGVATIKGDSDLHVTGGFQVGNGDLGSYGNAWPITGIVNQVSGRVTVTGKVGADLDSLHLGHWPMGRSTWNMMGGELTATDPAGKMAVAVDGQGVFNLSGGKVSTPEFCLNARNGNGGHGTLNMTGGELNLGGRGMTVGASCTTYACNLAGGTIRGWDTNTVIAVKASLTGPDAAACVTFDTQAGDIEVQQPLQGAGGFNKTGSGTLLVKAACTYAGVGRVSEGVARLGEGGSVTGTLAAVADGVVDLAGRTVTTGRFAGTGVVANGTVGAGATLEGGLAGEGTNTVRGVAMADGSALGVTVTAAGGCGVVDFDSAEAVELGRVKVTVSNPELLNPKKKYVFAQCAAGITASFDLNELPEGWHVSRRGNAFVLDGNNGTMVIVR